MKFSYDEIQVCYNEMQAIVEKIKSDLDNIKGILDKLSSSGYWTGNAYQYYDRKLKEITYEFEDVHIELVNNINYLQQTSENYNSLDKKIIMQAANMFNISEIFK